ncbi:MAG: bifunctional nuclease family protein [Bacteroidota bacterium]|nr:bifunctional nuclease family protein [Bacteroidota bacterium]|tara:strand:- start:1920 stop:2519 length:600 start_codon:yes stop_codon:yes gene_type:complete
MDLIRLLINGISYSQTQNGAYALILSELEGERKLPIVIGTYEAQSIAIAIEKDIKPPRPLTHDLFKSFCERFDITIKRVIIHKLVDGVFYSSIICDRDGVEEIIDSRTSDAIALASRFDAPIFTYENILEKAGIIIEIEEYDDEEKILFKELFSEETTLANSDDFKDKTIDELQKLLKIAVQNENYETAAKIRDEISNR